MVLILTLHECLVLVWFVGVDVQVVGYDNRDEEGGVQADLGEDRAEGGDVGIVVDAVVVDVRVVECLNQTRYYFGEQILV